MTAEESERLTRTAIACWDRSDWRGYRALAGPGYVYADSGTRIEGVENVLRRWGRIKIAFPDAAAEIVQTQTRADVAVAGVVWRATQTGLLQAAAGTESPSSKRVLIGDLIAMRWQHRKLVAERHHLGVLTLIAPLLDDTTPDPGSGTSAADRRPGWCSP